MNSVEERPLLNELQHGLSTLRGSWFLFVLLGISLIALGSVALSAVGVASLATAVAIGFVLLASGAIESIGSFWCRKWSGVFYHLLSGILSIVVGVLFLKAPVGALLALTLLIACFLMVGGIFKIVAALFYRFGAWGWPLLSGVIDVVLSVMILQDWPEAAFWVIGMFVGISLIFRGINWIGLGVAVKSLPTARV
ncbi:HdeD family acid-resistance protein [Planctomicrobium sp. SH527]|uniref:HdeD family acid-resistance protein n=1 Tax=Planctomicrobium sp. SH527 TaxID=3448123 RepID=UPI003F5C4A47